MILHIARTDAWEAARRSGWYEADSLASEGFIHCSRPDQIVETANARFRGRSDLVLLSIDPHRISAELRHENLEGGEDPYPHVYGPIELAAVVAAEPLRPEPDGRFSISEGSG